MDKVFMSKTERIWLKGDDPFTGLIRWGQEDGVEIKNQKVEGKTPNVG